MYGKILLLAGHERNFWGMVVVRHQKLQPIRQNFPTLPLFLPSAYTGHRSASKTEVNRQSMGESINCPCYRRISMAVKKYRRNKPIYARNTGIYNIKFTPLSPFSSLGVKYYPHVFACMSYTTSVST